jgi:hypothetical protein
MIIIAPQIAEFTPALFFRMMKLNAHTKFKVEAMGNNSIFKVDHMNRGFAAKARAAPIHCRRGESGGYCH